MLAWQGKLNAYDIDEIVSYLRGLFHEEEVALLSDITDLTSMLEEEDQDRSRMLKEARDAEDLPSTKDLRDFTHKLEKSWIDSDKDSGAEAALSALERAGPALSPTPQWGSGKAPLPSIPTSTSGSGGTRSSSGKTIDKSPLTRRKASDHTRKIQARGTHSSQIAEARA